MRPFADSVVDYAQAGWPCILPVPAEEKFPPPVGFTGEHGRDTDPLTLVAWASTHADWSVALRLPEGVIGIDVDHYAKGAVSKRGNDSLLRYAEKWGPLPATWSSTARGDLVATGPSRIMFFKVPAGRYATKLGESIEIIQRHHRYAVVAPSWHHQAGAAYRWYDPSGRLSDSVPKLVELPELPAAWVAGLREGANEAGPVSADWVSGNSMLSALLTADEPPCAEVASAYRQAEAELAASESGSRHDTAIARVHHLVMLGAAGHPGVGRALGSLTVSWYNLTSDENRQDEWHRMMLTSARKAVTLVGAVPVDRDPCLLTGGELWAMPTPAGSPAGAEVPAAPEPPRWWSVREVIGAHEFDPRANLDQTLSEEVLRRMFPVLRYGTDSGSWLLRGPDRWEVRGDLTRWAVHELASMMPRGNPDAEKGSDEHTRAARRRKLMSTAGRNAIGSSMAAAVAAGTHPCALELSRLDTEATVLWAGGQAWDLAASADTLTLAGFDPSTPHLHSAAVAPAEVPTPFWDAFLTSVWPDPEVRAWALRVLSVAFTGEPDEVLPILQGKRRRGKSQVVVLLMNLLGTYAIAADPRLLASADNSHASIVYALMGRRLAYVDEGPREGRWAQERLKQITGGAPLTGNRMRENPVTFNPTHTLVLTANDEPVLTDPAIRARVRLIPCNGDREAVRAARAAIGSTSGPVWRAEAPGVLAYMMREAGRWLTDRDSALTSAAPLAIRDQADLIAAEQDPARTWVEEETERHEAGTPSGELYSSFVAWCRGRNTHPSAIPSITAWGRGLNDLGHPMFRAGRGGVKHRGLRVRQLGGWVLTPPSDLGGANGGSPVGSPVGDHLATTVDTTETAGQAPMVSTVSPSSGTSTTTSEINKNKNIQVKGSSSLSGLPDPQNTPVFAAKGQGDHFEASGLPKADPTPVKPKRIPDADKVAAKLEKATEDRLAKIADAAGEAIPLPAAVNRRGEITPLSRDRAGLAVQAATARTGAMTVDVETSGYPVGHADYALKTIQLGGPDLAVVFDASDEDQAVTASWLLAGAPKLHAHSATADLVPLAHAGIVDESAWERMYDTVIPAKLADPASTGSDPGLKQLAPAVLGEAAVIPAADAARSALFKAGRWLTDTKSDTPLERSGWAQVDAGCATMIRYAGSDVLDTGALATKLPTVDPVVLDRERAVQRITARVTHRGLPIDGARVAEMTMIHTRARHVAGEKVRSFGIENPGSDRQIGVQLSAMGAPLARTKPSSRHPEGQPSVAEAALTPLKNVQGLVGQLVSAVLDYRHHDTVLGTFLGPYRELVERGDGRARPTIYTLGTDTGRMSCVRPNLQQLPREGGVRACITADPGHLLISADFSSVEVRVMAALSQDPNLIRILGEGADLHAIVAAQAFGPDWTKADRYTAKRGVFGWAYGGGVASLARQIGVSESMMAAVIDSLALVAPRYVQWGDELKRMVRKGATQMPTYAGRVIHLVKDQPHKAPNYAVQGTARELLVDALLCWDQTRWAGSIVLPVHDEIIAMVPEAEAQEATAALIECMTTELYGVPIVAEADQPSFAWQDAA